MNRVMITAGVSSLALLLSVPFIAEWEGKSNDPYKDIVGVPTVCYGETRVPMKTYTDDQCLQMLSNGVEEFQTNVLKCTPLLAGHPFQLAAATSLTYNIGPTAYCRSTAARRFNEGDFKGGCEAFKMWTKAGGRVVRGLVRRRQQEYDLCVTYLTSGTVPETT